MRSESDRMFSGVCGGIAAYLGVDSVFVRLAFLLLIFASGIGVILYVALMILMPSEANIDQPPSEVAQENIGQLGDEFTAGVKRVRRHPQGPAIAAGLLILLGFYFLFENLGWLNWIDGGLFWPVALIGLGLFLIARRSRS
jgi:phage shock protein PspC (stress-responsive transcriptional regulator)